MKKIVVFTLLLFVMLMVPSEQAMAQTLTTNSPSSFNLIKTADGLCLDVHSGDVFNNGGKVQVWRCHQAPNQQWYFRGVPNRPGAVQIVNKSGDMCLDVHSGDMGKSGGKVQIWRCHNGFNQMWRLDLRTGQIKTLDRSYGDMCLDVHSGDMGKSGGKVQIWRCHNGFNQRWTIPGVGF